MTAELSEGDTESRQKQVTSVARLRVDHEPGRGLKGGLRKDAGLNTAGLGDGNGGKQPRGTADLTKGFVDFTSRRPQSRKQGQGVEEQVVQENDKHMSLKGFRKAEGSSEGNRDEETEDDFEEVDGAIPEVVSDPPKQTLLGDRDLNQNLNRNEPLQQPMPPANPSPVSAGWESFLPQKKISVLLAEDDDSTRHVVGALLRNCSYEVTAVANGMQAWELLEDSSNHFDLVLTDVVMPCLSGVGLLTKITSNDSGKRIPVIMMSSHDSLDIVFRCLSKGAADFLVKPVRKNELKNLWQHVWRCQSSSGSGSGAGGCGSGSGNGKVGRTKSRVGSGNNTGSCDGSDDNSSGLNVWGGSDNGSGTQVAAHPNHKLKRDKTDADEGQATSLEKLSNQQMGQDLAMATRRSDSPEIEKVPEKKERHGAEATPEDLPSTSGNSGNKLENEEGGFGVTNSGGSSADAVDLIGGMQYQNKEDEGVESDDVVNGSDGALSNSPATDKCVTSSNSPPLLELSLKRPRSSSEDDNEDKRVIRHSGGSAFSRYGSNGTTIQQLPAGNSLSLPGHHLGTSYGTHVPPSSGVSLHFPKPSDRVGSSKGPGETTAPILVQSRTPTKEYGQDVGSSMGGGSSNQDSYTQFKEDGLSVSPLARKSIPISIPLPPQGYAVPNAYGPGMHQMFYTHSPAPRWAGGATQLTDREVFDRPPYHDHGSVVTFHPPHHSQSHHQSRLSQPFLHSPQPDQVVTTPGSGAPRCSSSNLLGSTPDGNAGQSGSSNGYGSNGNGSVNGSGSASNNQNGQSSAGMNNTTQNGDCGANPTGNGAAECDGGVAAQEQNRFARREAALNKFRQKRKERCFEKKVRYQSRKRLAEQRPRVRGQFVRQAVYNSNPGNEMVD